MLYYERKLKAKGISSIIGVDEAGRGPLAGPVVAAAVILKTHRFKNRIDDSKKLSPGLREKAFEEIIKKSCYSIAIVNQDIIDRINILEATRLAMRNAILDVVKKDAGTGNKRMHVIVDGNTKLDINLPFTSIIAGDSLSKSIASASILAKVTRDRIMDQYDVLFPEYGFLRHKGYPTKEHRDMIRKNGLSRIHRKSFSCV